MRRPTKESGAPGPALVRATFCLGLWRLARRSPVRWWAQLWACQPNALRSRWKETWISEARLAYQKTCPPALRAFIFNFDVAAPKATPEQLRGLREKTEHYCVVMQTLMRPPTLETEWVGHVLEAPH